jgi:hypothetical protein
MAAYAEAEIRAAFAPIASLVRKSEKAMQKLHEGTWQNAMLRDNLKALRLADALMRGAEAASIPAADFPAALSAPDGMLRRSEQAQEKFAAGTAQHSLLCNRIAALRIAEAFVAEEMERRRTETTGEGETHPAVFQAYGKSNT